MARELQTHGGEHWTPVSQVDVESDDGRSPCATHGIPWRSRCVKTLLSLLAIGLTAWIALELRPRVHFHKGVPSGQDLPSVRPSCYDVSEKDWGICINEINLARTVSIFEYPERYPGITASASLARWQAFMFQHAEGKCPAPCTISQLSFCNETAPPNLWEPFIPSRAVRAKALSYNLFWWNLFGLHNGRQNSAGKLIAGAMSPAIDFMGLQECEDPYRVLGPVGLLSQFEVFKGFHALCMAYRRSDWSLLTRGEIDVAEDQWTQYYGARGAQWMRLRHKSSEASLLFVNHHGPLPVNTGGQCGGRVTADNLLRLISDSGKDGDIIFLVGDFNANAGSPTITHLQRYLVRLHHGESFGGVDNIFSNVGNVSIFSASNLGTGGSDHQAISVMVSLGVERTSMKLSDAFASEPTGALQGSWEH
mmetsp:Transcript_106954/g.300781  ORF Transcript_106954/g.300781 Transcript_106954/m.300781 type:complete len:421 (+) Transcript_106954:83-1345(+)